MRIELERRRMEVTYVRTREGYEVDFMARPIGESPMLIQVCAELDDPQTQERAVRALLAVAKEYPEASLHLVTLTPEEAMNIPNSIKVHSAALWLLGAAGFKCLS